MIIARGRRGWWQRSFLMAIQQTATIYANICASLPQDINSNSIQRYFYRKLRFSLPVALKDCPETGLLKRIQAWRPGISPGT
eukprot:4917111-Pyramimonas_sp.AAC.1